MAEDIVTKVSQDHKQRGFDKGWSSRFKTVFELARLFGFVWFNEPEFKKEEIKVTNLGNKLAEFLNSIICQNLGNLNQYLKENNQFFYMLLLNIKSIIHLKEC